jgi:hypothetical protein
MLMEIGQLRFEYGPSESWKGLDLTGKDEVVYLRVRARALALHDIFTLGLPALWQNTDRGGGGPWASTKEEETCRTILTRQAVEMLPAGTCFHPEDPAMQSTVQGIYTILPRMLRDLAQGGLKHLDACHAQQLYMPLPENQPMQQ